MNRFKNVGLWIATFALVPLIAEALGTYNINVILPGNYDVLVKAVLGVLVLAGILSNPTTENRGYLDD